MTVAVNVTDCPTLALASDEATATELAIEPTDSGFGAEALSAKLASPV